jgi:hypothetical protein
MSATNRHPYSSAERSSPERFQVLFDREPSSAELSVFAAAHQALVLRLPGRVRRRTARVISRL